ncbi:hypothetical protein NPX99_05425 [Bartonella sp. 220]|uniref:hypothetical protein n=1 Tax=Bartonella sp. 220B TaxID=2967260 RepID=UPI0022A979EE|nr:hypothetical protein [Bartonella sp. 220B]MCZ2158713.1 hypothetical protein [Bartonella sp. 220B]
MRKEHNTPLVTPLVPPYGKQPSLNQLNLNQASGKQLWKEAQQEFYKDGDDEKF